MLTYLSIAALYFAYVCVRVARDQGEDARRVCRRSPLTTTGLLVAIALVWPLFLAPTFIRERMAA